MRLSMACLLLCIGCVAGRAKHRGTKRSLERERAATAFAWLLCFGFRRCSLVLACLHWILVVVFVVVASNLSPRANRATACVLSQLLYRVQYNAILASS